MTTLPATTRPDASVLLAQLCRHFAQATSLVGGLVYNDLGETTPANLYAGPMPPREFRLGTAVGFASVSVTGGEDPGMSPVVTHTVSVECRAPTRQAAVGVLNDLLRVLRPQDRPFVWRPPQDAGATFERQGVIGAPSVSETATIWRVIAIEVSGSPEPADIELSSASDDGLGSAILTLQVIAVPDEMPAPATVLSVWHGGAGGVVEAQARVTMAPGGGASQLLLRTRTIAGGAWASRAVELDQVYASWEALRSEIAGGGWTATVDEAAPELVEGVRASALIETWASWRPALGAPSTRSLRWLV